MRSPSARDESSGLKAILCLGESMVLVTPRTSVPLAGSEDIRLEVAGAESNVALYMNDLGHQTVWVSQVGDDPMGRRIIGYLTQYGVDTDLVRYVSNASTGIFFKDPGRENSRVYYYRKGSAASLMSPALLDVVPWHSFGHAHVSGITPALSHSCYSLITSLFAEAHEQSVPVSFDVNFRPALWDATTAGPVLLDLARKATHVLVGLDEAAALWGTPDADAVRELMPHVANVVVKDGAVGATSYSESGKTFAPALKTSVVEVVGAGDAFAAGYLSAYIKGRDPMECLNEGHRIASRALGSTSDYAPIEVS